MTNERLTYTYSDGIVHIKFHETILDRMHEAFDKLAEYEDLQERGQMIILPCPEGIECFKVGNNTSACATCTWFNDHVEMDTACESPHDLIMNPEMSDVPLCNGHFYEVQSFTPDVTWIVSNMPLLGDTWFLTREEAIQKLEEMNKEIGRDF